VRVTRAPFAFVIKGRPGLPGLGRSAWTGVQAPLSLRATAQKSNSLPGYGEMSVRKRTWTTSKGETKEAWIVDYVGGKGERCIKTFARKKDADAYHAKVTVDVAKGIHTPESRSLTVASAAQQWLHAAELEGLERSTLDHYRTHVIKHIQPRIGAAKLAALTTPQVNAFRDSLLHDMSRPMARKVLASFRSIIKDARGRGTIAHNVAEGVKVAAAKRARRNLEVGRDIPTPDEVRRILRSRTGALARLPGRRRLHRLARVRAARSTLVRYRLLDQHRERAAARRRLGDHWSAQDPFERASDSYRAVRRQYAQGMEAGLPKG
jgi:hypothetical protein